MKLIENNVNIWTNGKIKKEKILEEGDPVLYIIGSISAEPLTSEGIDKELYGEKTYDL